MNWIEYCEEMIVFEVIEVNFIIQYWTDEANAP